MTLNEPAKAKAGTPCKAKGPVAVQTALLPENEKEFRLEVSVCGRKCESFTSKLNISLPHVSAKSKNHSIFSRVWSAEGFWWYLTFHCCSDSDK